MSFDSFKSFCSDHPYEPITNFCAQKECLVGLCATCVCFHTQFHMKIGTCPVYENIKDTFGKMNEKVRAQVDKIESTKQKLDCVCEIINEKKNQVRQSLEKARADCLALANRHFDELEVKMEAEINSESKKNSLHNTYRLDSLNTLILKEISNLLTHANDLNSPNFLSAIKRIELEAIPNSEDFFNRVCNELKQNEIYTASVVYRNEYLAEVKIVLNKLINLQFLLPNMRFMDQGKKQVQFQDQQQQQTSQMQQNQMQIQQQQQQLQLQIQQQQQQQQQQQLQMQMQLQQQQQQQQQQQYSNSNSNSNQFNQSRAQSLQKSIASNLMQSQSNVPFKMLPPTVIDTKTKMSSSNIFKPQSVLQNLISRNSPISPLSQSNLPFKAISDIQTVSSQSTAKGKTPYKNQNMIKNLFDASQRPQSLTGDVAVSDKENDFLAYSTFIEQNFLKRQQ